MSVEDVMYSPNGVFPTSEENKHCTPYSDWDRVMDLAEKGRLRNLVYESGTIPEDTNFDIVKKSIRQNEGNLHVIITDSHPRHLFETSSTHEQETSSSYKKVTSE